LARAALHGASLAAAGSGTGAGPFPDELTRLDYPLHPGAKWVLRTDPYFTGTVERVELVDLPAGRFQAYRIRLGSDLFGPNDRVLLYWGRSGELGHSFHLEIVATDENGNPIGNQVADETEQLRALHLVGSGQVAAAP
jgi:hypothetical protein